MVPHRAVVNFLHSMAREPGLDASDRLLAVTTLSFDIAVLELLLPLMRGAELVLASAEQALDATALQRLMREHRITGDAGHALDTAHAARRRLDRAA